VAVPAVILVVIVAGQVRRPREVLGEPDDRRLRPGVGGEAGEPVVEAEAVRDDEIRLDEPPGVARRRIEGMDLAAFRDEGGHPDPPAADLGDEIGEHGRRRHDLDLRGRRRSAAVGGAGLTSGEDEGEDAQDGDAASGNGRADRKPPPIPSGGG
jgi:hypothetical protein